MLNNAWTFRYRPKAEHIGIRGLKFNMVSLASLAVTFGTFVILSKLFPDLPLQIDQLAAILPTTAMNYFLNSYWTFKWHPPAREFPLVDTPGAAAEVVRNRSTLS
jgi:dolichol-phosphate mannosyltransferase